MRNELVFWGPKKLCPPLPYPRVCGLENLLHDHHDEKLPVLLPQA